MARKLTYLFLLAWIALAVRTGSCINACGTVSRYLQDNPVEMKAPGFHLEPSDGRAGKAR